MVTAAKKLLRRRVNRYWLTTMSDRRSYSLESRRGSTTHTTLAGEKKPFAKRRVTSRHSQVITIESTARPGVRRGDVSEEPWRWLLIAVLVAALVPTTRARCFSTQSRVDCDVYEAICIRHANSNIIGS